MSASAPASTRDAVLSLLLERGEEDAGTLADAVGISVQAMRRHLRSLADSGLVCSKSNASGPGRPSNRWCLTDEGRAQFPDGSGRFALGLLDSMRSHLPEATVRQLLNQQAESKASQYRQSLGEASLEARLEHLARLRRDEGYVTVCSRDDDGVSWRLEGGHACGFRITPLAQS